MFNEDAFAAANLLRLYKLHKFNKRLKLHLMGLDPKRSHSILDLRVVGLCETAEITAKRLYEEQKEALND